MSELCIMYAGLTRKQGSFSKQDRCWVCVDLMLQQDAEGRPEGDFHWNIHLFKTDMAAPPPPPRPQSGPLLQSVARRGTGLLPRAPVGSKKCVWSLRLVWVCASFALQPPANTKPTLSHFSIFSTSFFRTLEALTASPQPLTPPWAHHTLAAATRHSSPR